MNEEIKRILKLVEEGKINSDQATDLIDAMKQDDTGALEQSKPAGRNLKVSIISHKGENLNIKLPLKFVRGILKATGKLPMKIEGGEEIDLEAVREAILSETSGKIVEMDTSKGDHIEVLID